MGKYQGQRVVTLEKISDLDFYSMRKKIVFDCCHLDRES